jgi:DNA-binding response OmpR family regulator
MRLAGTQDPRPNAPTQSNRIVLVGDAGSDLSTVLTLLRDAGHQVVHYDPSVPLLAVGARATAAELTLRDIDAGVPQEEIVVGEFVLDPSMRTLRHGVRTFSLTPRQFLVMLALMRAPERALSRAELCREAGIRSAKAAARGRSLDMQILHLRKFIEADSARPQHILTVRQVGYRFAPVASSVARYPRRIA